MISTKTYPGADVPSDFNILLSRFKLLMKKVRKGKAERTIQQQSKQHSYGSYPKNTSVNDFWNIIKNISNSVVDSKLNPGKSIETPP